MVHLEARFAARAALAALAALALAAFPAAAQVVGENVNMVSGTQWPGGDPFLQRQNEPTLAVSSVNPQHLLAAANDYRSVDLPNPNFGLKVNGDAWLGIFKSLDGGQTWKSVLLPGYPQDKGCTSPAPPAPVGHVHHHRCGHVEAAPTVGGQYALCGLPAAADPVVRAGTDGMFYVGGINFQRDKTRSRLFIGRYVDANNKENGDATKDSDAIRYVDTRVIAESAPNVFIDKPWFAVDVPRAGASTCSVPLTEDPNGPKRTFLGGTVYAAWAEFTLPNEDSSTLKFTWSKDCGRTWVTPMKVNTLNGILNQGVTIAIEPITGRVYLAWRRFAVTGKQADAILVTRSEGRSKHFASPRVISKTFSPFEQFMDDRTFRTEAFPSLAISTDGTKSWAHVAWSQRKATLDGRIFMSTAQVHPPPQGDQDADEAEENDDETRLQWSAPAAVDDAPIADDAGHAFSRGHQTMPSLTFSQGRLVLVYYDTRMDHTRRYYRPRIPFAPTNGHFYEELLAPLGELVGAGPGGVFAPTITDAGLTQVRRTVDVRVAVAGPGPTQTWKAVQANKFSFGLRGDEFSNGGQGLTVDSFDGAANRITVVDGTGKVQLLQQLQHNPPNLPIFKNGTRPFMGDYIDIQGPAFATTPAGGWVHNTAPTAAPVFHAVWTSNQDVKAPPVVNGQPDWAGYTPIGGGGASVYDPLVMTPACNAAYAGTRDQNIYTARITEGLAVSSPQNQKALSPAETRTFVVASQNTTPEPMTVDLVATPGDSPGLADFSFVNDLSPGGGRTTALRGVVIPAGSTVVRTLFARSDSPSASIKVLATETCAKAPCRSGFVILNPPVALATLLQPDGTGAPLSAGEQYAIQIMAPNVTNPNVTNPNVTNPNVTNPNVTNPNVTNPNVTNPNVTNPNVTNPNVTNPNVTNPNVTNPNVTNPNVTNPNVTNPNVTNPNVTNPNVTNPNVTNPNVTNPNVTNAAVSDLSYTVANTGNTTTTYAIQLVKFEDGYQAPSPVQLIISRTYYTPAADGCVLKEVPHDQILVNVPDVSQALISSKSVVDPNVTNPNVTNATLALPPGETAVITLRAFVTLPQMAALGAKLGPAAIPQSYRPRPGVTYENIASVLPGAGVVVPGAASRTQLTYDRATGLASVQIRPASGAGPTPTGQVYLIANDTWRVAAFTLDASGSGSATIAPALPVGTNLVVYYAGDAAYAGSVSGAVTVASIGTSPVTVTVNYDPAASTATAGVSGSGSGGASPTGQVTFLRNGTPIGTAALVAYSGTPGLSYAFNVPLPQLAATDTLTASFPGDTTFAASASPPLVVSSVMVAVQGVGLSYDILTNVARAALWFYSPPVPAPTGTLTFSVGTRVLMTLDVSTGLPSGGSVQFQTTVPQLAPGDQLVVTYSGDHTFLSGASPPMVVQAEPSTVLATYSPYDSTVSALVCGRPSGPAPSGQVTFHAGALAPATADLSAGTVPNINNPACVQVTIPVTRLVPGTEVSATYSGDFRYTGATSNVYPVPLMGPWLTASYDILSSTASVYLGTPGIFRPTGTVNFTVGTSAVGSTDLSTGTFTYSAPSGQLNLVVSLLQLHDGDSLVITYSGDPYFAGTSYGPITVQRYVVGLAITGVDTILNVLRGQVSWPAGGPVPTGTVSFSTNNGFVGSAPVGNVVSLVASTALIEGMRVNMSYTGDQFYRPASASLCCVTRASTVTSITASDVFAGSVQVNVQGPATTGPLPLGWLYLQRGGVQSGVGYLDATGSASISVSGLARGQVLQVHYDGNGGYAPSDSAPFPVPGVATTATATYDPATAGVGVTVTPLVAGLPAAPTGAADLYAGGLVAGSITLTPGGPGGASAGTGSLVGPPPSVGKQLQVHYVGDQYFEEAVSAPELMTGFSLAAPMAEPRRAHATVAVGTTIYVLGGRNTTGSLTSVAAYDTLTGTWTAKAPAPMAFDMSFTTLAVAWSGKILAFKPGLPVLEYDPAADAWTTRVSLVPTFGNHPKALVVGGRIMVFSALQTAWEYDPAAESWIGGAGPALDNRLWFVAGVAGGKAYFIGGDAPHNTGSPWAVFLDSVLEYDPAVGTLTTFPQPLLHPVEYDTAAEVNGKLYVLGSTANGIGSSSLWSDPKLPQVIDPVGRTITSYPVPWSAPRYATSAAAVNGVIYLPGGVLPSGSQVVSTVDAFYPAP